MCVGRLLNVAIAKGDLGTVIARVKGGRKGGKGSVDAGKGDKGTIGDLETVISRVIKGYKGGRVDAGKGDNQKDGEGGKGGDDKGGKDKGDEVESKMFVKGNISCPHCLSTVSIFTEFEARHRVRSYPY
jgi:hypothetical protein